MKKSTLHQALRGATLSLSMVLIPLQLANACTRAVYLGPENTIVTARSMDWKSDLGSNLWAFARGMQRDGAAGPNSIRWTSKYGSVVTTAFEAATADGMNEKGLVANLLYLAEADYVKPAKDDKRQPLSISVWAQYLLDNYASVAEAVASVRSEPFYVVPTLTPDGEKGALHLSISDASGDSAIFEYVEGKLTIHHGRQYQVMTNSPTYDKQLALNNYWEQIGGATLLPGTNRAADRFVRASYYINTVPQTANNSEAIAGAFSVIRNVSAPLGVSIPGQPNIASTLWRTVSDHKNLRYYFESTRSPNVFWVNLTEMDFAAGQPTKKLTLTDGAVFAGNAAAQFKVTPPFAFLAAEVN